MQASRVYPKRKVRMLSALKEYASKYNTIALIKMEKVKAEQLMVLRKKFGDQLKIIMVKNNIARKALTDVKGIEKLFDRLIGQNALIFTNMNPFKLSLLIEKEKIKLPAKGGDIATSEIVIPAGNTGLAPGPVLSEFREAKIQTKIEGGTIWIAKDSVVAKPGDVISHKLASILGKLGIKPIEAGLALDLVLEDGLLYKQEDLKIDIEATKRALEDAFKESLNLAINAAYPTRESIEHILRKAYMNARTLSINAAYPTRDTIIDILLACEMKSRAILEIAKNKGYT